MAKDKLTDYDATASNNSDVGGVNTAEGMLPSKVNDAIRELMSHLADFSGGTTGVDVLNLQDDDNSASIKFQAPSAVTTTVTFTLPDGDGSANQLLQTNGSGTLAWADPSVGGGSFLGEAGGGLGDIIRVHEKQLDTDVTVATDTNGLAAGPLAIASGVTVTVSSGATLVVA
jgi:hypothetical protein